MSDPEKNEGGMAKLRIICAIAILVLTCIVALSPSLVYAPTPKVILYLLAGILPAILLGAEIGTRLELKLPGFCLVATGASAICIGVLWLLTYLSKPEEQIAVFHVEDEQGQEVDLQWKGALEVKTTGRGLTVTHYVTKNTVVLIFPEQVANVEVKIKKSSQDPAYSGEVSYAGSRTSKLKLGKDLKKP